MDFHKLQETLNAIEPSDRARDIEMLRRSASGDTTPVERQEVRESTAPTKTAHLSEAAQMAALAGINTSSSTPRVNSEAAQMAALAGITVNESQRTGKVGQVKGSEAVKSNSKPSSRGEQEHPFDDRLVGSAEVPRDNADEDVEEAGAWDQVKSDWAQGAKNANNLKAFKGVLGNKKSKKSSAEEQPGTEKPQSEQTLPPKLAQAMAKYSTALSNITRNPKLTKQFQALMKAADPDLQLESYIKEHEQPKPVKKVEPVVESTTATSSNKDSIKAELLRRLNQQK